MGRTSQQPSNEVGGLGCIVAVRDVRATPGCTASAANAVTRTAELLDFRSRQVSDWPSFIWVTEDDGYNEIMSAKVQLLTVT